MSPEDAIQQWRNENFDDPENHDFSEDIWEPGATCTICDDNAAGLLHAFDSRFQEGYFDEPILDVIEYTE